MKKLSSRQQAAKEKAQKNYRELCAFYDEIKIVADQMGDIYCRMQESPDLSQACMEYAPEIRRLSAQVARHFQSQKMHRLLRAFMYNKHHFPVRHRRNGELMYQCYKSSLAVSSELTGQWAYYATIAEAHWHQITSQSTYAEFYPYILGSKPN